MKFCGNCNKYFSDDTKFCPHCGKELGVVENSSGERIENKPTYQAKSSNSMYGYHNCAPFAFGIIHLISIIFPFCFSFFALTDLRSEPDLSYILSIISLIVLIPGIILTIIATAKGYKCLYTNKRGFTRYSPWVGFITCGLSLIFCLICL